MESTQMSRFQLSYNAEWDRYVLRPVGTLNDPCTSYEMAIECSWDETDRTWYHYRFYRWTDGEWYELVTRKQMNAMENDVLEHEGEEVANLWAEHQMQYEQVRDDHWCFELRNRWEAMMELELFSIPVTLKAWPSKPLPQDIITRMDMLRQTAQEAWQESE
jgi:hypothetical protein